MPTAYSTLRLSYPAPSPASSLTCDSNIATLEACSSLSRRLDDPSAKHVSRLPSKSGPRDCRSGCRSSGSGHMTYRVAAATFRVSKSSIMSRVKGQTGVNASVGPPIVLTRGGECARRWCAVAAHRYLGLSRAEFDSSAVMADVSKSKVLCGRKGGREVA